MCLVLLCSIKAFAQSYSPALFTQEDYQKFTYDWIDKDGVPHTSDVTETATSTEQIMALVKEVYTNPGIPGTHYARPCEKEGIARYNFNVTGWDAIAPVPNKDGYTLILVAMHDDWSASGYSRSNFRHAPAEGYGEKSLAYRYINESIKWVKLVPNGARIEDRDGCPNRSGVIFNVDATLNRFYFMTKGKTRNTGSYPFNSMFELFSPTTNTSSADTPNFYDKMVAGSTYDILHDCGTVENLEHYFAMNGKKGTNSYDMTGLVFYIPDHRYDSWASRDNDGQWTWYNPDYAPKTMMYTIHLKAMAERAVTSDGSRKYDVTLTWTSSLDNLVPNSTLVQEYDIYIVVNGVRQPVPIATGVTGNTYTYQVPQELKGYDITYQISGRPLDTEFNKAWSNTDVVTIPGYDPFERLNLSIVGNYKSTYDQYREVNDYENLITMTNNTADPSTALKGNMIDEKTTFELYRFDNEVAEPVLEHIATVAMAAKQQVGEEWRFPFTVTYDNITDGVIYPAMSGYFTAETENGVLTLGENGLQLMDAFCASTKYNDHPDHYDYQIKFVSAVDIIAPDGVTKSNNAYSNVARVPVYKTSIDVSVPFYSEEDVIADVNHSLDLSTVASIGVNMNNYSNVKDYLVRRDAKNAIGIVQKNQDGSYTSFRRDESGFNTVIERRSFEGDKLTMSIEDDGRDVTKTSSTSYVGVIEAYTKNTIDETVISTYGSDIKRVEMANLEINITNQGHKNSFGPFGYQVSNPIVINGVKKSGYFFNLNLTSFLSEALSVCGDGTEIPNYRVWRVVDDEETLIAGDQLTVVGNTGSWTFGYRYWPYLHNNKLLIQDFFMGKPIENKASGEVNYIARVYAKAAPAANNGVKLAANDGVRYYVAENTIGVRFINDGVVTGIECLDADRSVASVTYYNSLGCSSSEPFSGMNIVVTRYSDGSSTTSRLVK